MRGFGFSLFYVMGGIFAGIFTAMQALGGAGLQPVAGGAGWQEWRLGENDRLLPYALGHFLSAGQVPPQKASRYFVRDRDDDGNVLSSDCVFKIEGPAIPARWWSLSVGQNPNAILPAGQAILDSNNNLTAWVARHPQPGNWLTPPDTRSYTITYVVSQPAKQKAGTPLALPHVKKTGC